MDQRKIFLGALIACLVVVAAALGITYFLGGDAKTDYGSIHTTQAVSETQTTEETREELVITEPETEESSRAAESATSARTERETTARQTTEALPQYTVSMEEKVFGNGNVTIQYPVVSGMEDEQLQAKINQNLSGNATSIISLYPVNLSTDQLTVSCKLNYIDRRRVSVIYTGKLYQPVQEGEQDGSDLAPGTGTQGSQDGMLAPGETWAPPGEGQSGLPENLQATNAAPGEPTTAQLAPGETAAAGRQEAGTGAGGGTAGGGADAAGMGLGKRIFYTNTINLRTGSSMSLKDFVDARTLGGYVLDKSCQFEGVDEKTLSYIKVYLSAHDNSYYETIFQNADFPLKTTAWPQSFCYENQGDIVFSVPVSNGLGDYVLARYVPKTK